MRHTAESSPAQSYQPILGDRRLFPHLDPLVYLNHAAISPPSIAVRHAVTTLLDDYARHGMAAYPTWKAQRQRLRHKLATLIGTTADQIAFTSSTTRGITDIALCLPWKPHDRILLFQGEFPANVTPWQRAAQLFDLELVFHSLDGFMSPNGNGLEQLEHELRRGLRLVSVSAVQFQTGLKMPLEAMAALCHAHGAELFVDAVQACGAVPLDVTKTPIDYLACGSHKWLMGLEGAGFVYIAQNRVSALRPTVAGWMSHQDSFDFLIKGSGLLHYDRPLRQTADFLEGSNVAAMSFAALEAALNLLIDLTVPAIYEHINLYLDSIEQGLVERGFHSLRATDPSHRSASLCVKPPDSITVVDLHKALTQLGISCSIPDGNLRFAPHWPNALDEVDQVLLSVDQSLK